MNVELRKDQVILQDRKTDRVIIHQEMMSVMKRLQQEVRKDQVIVLRQEVSEVMIVQAITHLPGVKILVEAMTDLVIHLRKEVNLHQAAVATHLRAGIILPPEAVHHLQVEALVQEDKRLLHQS